MSVTAAGVKRIVALTRQKALYSSMARRGELSADELTMLVIGIDAEIAMIRSQTDLALAPPAAPSVPAQKAGKGA